MFLQLLSLLSVTCVTDKKKKGRAVAGTEEKINLHTYKKKREKKIECAVLLLCFINNSLQESDQLARPQAFFSRYFKI